MTLNEYVLQVSDAVDRALTDDDFTMLERLHRAGADVAKAAAVLKSEVVAVNAPDIAKFEPAGGDNVRRFK